MRTRLARPSTLIVVAALAAGAGLAATRGQAAGPFVGGHVLAGSALSVTLADPARGLATTSDRVDGISWTDSSGLVRANYVANGGGQCGDAYEFFGQSYGEPEGTRPYVVVSGSASRWSQKSPPSGKAKTTSAANCFGPPDVGTLTAYRVFTTNAGRNELKITRSFLFTAASPTYATHGLRSYVPRLPLTIYPNVLWPNAAGTALRTLSAGACAADCEETDWNGRWFADDNGAGFGMAVIRDAASTAPALLTINNDTISGSNLSSVVLIEPAGGWHTTVKEIERLCFYDPISWTAADRAALRLPSGCSA